MENKDNANQNQNSSSSGNSDDSKGKKPFIPFAKISGEERIEELNRPKEKESKSKEPIVKTGVKTSESLEFIEISPLELINIKKVPKFKIINNHIKGEVLGEGVFAKVREFVNKNTLERFAGKIMKIEKIYKMGRNVEMNVMKELKLVRKLKHKNIIKMIDIYKTKHKIYIFMEYCAGVLKEMIEMAPNNRLPISQSHNYFSQMIEGLQYIHSKGIFHRDIKTDNLLINSAEVIKIADFGVAFALGSFESNDLISGYEGTKLYQPPELIDPDIKFYSGSKFDIWSSGVILFNMISGMFPFFNEHNDCIWDKNAFNQINYPQVISDDKLLQNLFQRIFEINFNDRISIEEIKKNSWFLMNHSENGEYVALPETEFRDLYRGMTVLERIRVHLNDPTVDHKKIIFCNEADYEESIKPKSPDIRTDRIRRSRSPQKRKRSPFTRIIRMGLHIADE